MIRASDISSALPPIFLNSHVSRQHLQERQTFFSRAARLDPLEGRYRDELGRLSVYLHDDEQARQEFLHACRLDPSSSVFLQQLGHSLTNLGPEQQQKFLQLGINRQPLIIDHYLNYGDWLLRQNRREEAFAVFNHAITTVPWEIVRTGRFLCSRLTAEEIRRLLPPLPEPWHEIGLNFERRRLAGEAELFYYRSLEFLEHNPPQVVYFNRLYQLLLREKKEKQALQVLRRGIEEIPDYAPFRITLGDYYLGQGIVYRARQEYNQALRLKPGDRTAQRKLAILEEN